MAEFTTILTGVSCAAAGGLLAWAILRQRYAAGVMRAREAASEERLTLSTQLATMTEKASRLPGLAGELQERDRLLDGLRNMKGELEARVAELRTQLQEERQQTEEKLALVHGAERQMKAQFEALSLEALKKSGEAFLSMAKAQLGEFQQRATGNFEEKEKAIAELLKPVKESLARVDAQMKEIEVARAGAYEGLVAQVRSLAEGQNLLRGETGRLVMALHSPVARGRWGEIQLKRVVELAGMLDHCDFYEQVSVENDARRLRPDMLVKMPGGKTIVVDSKVPFSAYYRAFESGVDAARAAAFREHASAVREHAKVLATKSYWEQFDETPEFVVLFLPGEAFFSAALEQDPELIEFGAANRVILATPTTLIALLRAVHYGWRQEKLAENAQQISSLGRDLYERLATLGEHMARLGKHLDGAVDAYNKAAGSLETRVLVTARRFKELHAATDREIKVVDQLEHTTRSLQSAEFQAKGEEFKLDDGG